MLFVLLYLPKAAVGIVIIIIGIVSHNQYEYFAADSRRVSQSVKHINQARESQCVLFSFHSACSSCCVQLLADISDFCFLCICIGPCVYMCDVIWFDMKFHGLTLLDLTWFRFVRVTSKHNDIVGNFIYIYDGVTALVCAIKWLIAEVIAHRVILFSPPARRRRPHHDVWVWVWVHFHLRKSHNSPINVAIKSCISLFTLHNYSIAFNWFRTV